MKLYETSVININFADESKYSKRYVELFCKRIDYVQSDSQMSDDDFEDASASDQALKKTFHRWEQTGKAWDTLTAVNGHLISIMKEGMQWDSVAVQKKSKLRGFSRGLIRSMAIIIDLSIRGLETRDFGLPRIRIIMNHLKTFISNFIDQNPLSQIAIIGTYNSRAYMLSPLCGEIEVHLESIAKMIDLDANGEASIENSLIVAKALLKTVPVFSTKEVLFMYGSLNTNDPNSFNRVLEIAKESKMTISIISFNAKIFVFEQLAEATGGSYYLPTSTEHFADILMSHTQPPHWSQTSQIIRFIEFGFAKAPSRSGETPSFDLVELEKNPDGTPKLNGYACPRCSTRVFNVPVFCPSCGILVISPAHLTRAMHHLKPLADFNEVPKGEKRENVCFGCNKILEAPIYLCPICNSCFCEECNKFVHECLQNCPGCQAILT